MGTVVNLDPDLEQLLRREARDRNLEFDRVLNDAVRAGFAQSRSRFVQRTFPMGAMDDPKKILAELDELDDLERMRKMHLPETR